MPVLRLARLDAPGILHHARGRDIERKEIFYNDTDRNDFIRLRLNTLELVEGMIGLRRRLPTSLDPLRRDKTTLQEGMASRRAPTCPEEVLTKSEAH